MQIEALIILVASRYTYPWKDHPYDFVVLCQIYKKQNISKMARNVRFHHDNNAQFMFMVCVESG